MVSSRIKAGNDGDDRWLNGEIETPKPNWWSDLQKWDKTLLW